GLAREPSRRWHLIHHGRVDMREACPEARCALEGTRRAAKKKAIDPGWVGRKGRPRMDIQLKGKRVLVTGGNSGIGEAMALAFADAGANVAINYIANESAAKQLVQTIEAKGRKALALKANVAEEQEVAKMFGELDRAWGGIDVLLDNAGIDGKRILSF